MQEVYDAEFCSLHVRVTNRAALGLYEGKLGYTKLDVEEKYYADEEDAYNMKKFFKEQKPVSAMPTSTEGIKEVKEEKEEKKVEKEPKVEPDIKSLRGGLREKKRRTIRKQK